MKITSEIKSNIIKQYASGFSAREIAKSLHLSHTAVSKILNEHKNCQGDEKVAKQVAKQDNQKIAKEIIDKAMFSVLGDIEKASPKDRIFIAERLMFLYGNNEDQKSALDRVVEAITGVINED